MIAVRVSSSRADYARGGLLFAEPQARRIGGGRLAIDLTMDKFMALGRANVLELRADPAIRIEPLQTPATAHAVYRARQAAHQARHPHMPIRRFQAAAPVLPATAATAGDAEETGASTLGHTTGSGNAPGKAGAVAKTAPAQAAPAKSAAAQSARKPSTRKSAK